MRVCVSWNIKSLLKRKTITLRLKIITFSKITLWLSGGILFLFDC